MQTNMGVSLNRNSTHLSHSCSVDCAHYEVAQSTPTPPLELDRPWWALVKDWRPRKTINCSFAYKFKKWQHFLDLRPCSVLPKNWFLRVVGRTETQSCCSWDGHKQCIPQNQLWLRPDRSCEFDPLLAAELSTLAAEKPIGDSNLLASSCYL